MKYLILVLMMCVSLFANAQEKQVDNFKKTDEVLSEIVKKALTVAEKTGDFVIEQTPLLLQEFYRWHIAKSSLSILISLFTVICILVLINKHRKYVAKEELDMSDPECFFPRIFGWIGFFVAVGFFISYVYDLAFILFAPKLYLIEYFVK